MFNTKRDKCLLQMTRLFIRIEKSGARSRVGMALIPFFRLEIIFFVKGTSPVKSFNHTYDS